MPFWTRVAERMIQQITAYTGEGVMFAVDTRLRPNGREGPLVQTEHAFKDYFAEKAEAWEGITYMKSRAVAGNTRARHANSSTNCRMSTGAATAKAAVRRRSYGRCACAWSGSRAAAIPQGGPRRLLRHRFRADVSAAEERRNFFQSAEYAGRIDIIEKNGTLWTATMRNFCSDAATFYRAIDHGLRCISGHAEGNLPKSRPQLEALEQLVGRWTPDHLHDQPLDVELAQIQSTDARVFRPAIQIAPRAIFMRTTAGPRSGRPSSLLR